MILYVQRPKQGDHQIEYDNCRVIDGLSGAVGTDDPQIFEEHMRFNHPQDTLIWVDDLDAAWERLKAAPRRPSDRPCAPIKPGR